MWKLQPHMHEKLPKHKLDSQSQYYKRKTEKKNWQSITIERLIKQVLWPRDFFMVLQMYNQATHCPFPWFCGKWIKKKIYLQRSQKTAE